MNVVHTVYLGISRLRDKYQLNVTGCRNWIVFCIFCNVPQPGRRCNLQNINKVSPKLGTLLPLPLLRIQVFILFYYYYGATKATQSRGPLHSVIVNWHPLSDNKVRSASANEVVVGRCLFHLSDDSATAFSHSGESIRPYLTSIPPSFLSKRCICSKFPSQHSYPSMKRWTAILRVLYSRETASGVQECEQSAAHSALSLLLRSSYSRLAYYATWGRVTVCRGIAAIFLTVVCTSQPRKWTVFIVPWWYSWTLNSAGSPHAAQLSDRANAEQSRSILTPPKVWPVFSWNNVQFTISQCNASYETAAFWTHCRMIIRSQSNGTI